MTSSLLNDLAKAGIQVSIKEGKLALTGPKVALTPELVEDLRQHKAEIRRELVIEALAGRKPCPCGWFCCYEPEHSPSTLALPCCVVKGEKTLEGYAAECYPQDTEAQAGLVGMYADAYRVFLAARELGLINWNITWNKATRELLSDGVA